MRLPREAGIGPPTSEFAIPRYLSSSKPSPHSGGIVAPNRDEVENTNTCSLLRSFSAAGSLAFLTIVPKFNPTTRFSSSKDKRSVAYVPGAILVIMAVQSAIFTLVSQFREFVVPRRSSLLNSSVLQSLTRPEWSRPLAYTKGSVESTDRTAWLPAQHPLHPDGIRILSSTVIVLHNDGGIHPLMSLLPEIVNTVLVSTFNVVVICPRNWLRWRRKDRRVVLRLARDAGMVPVRVLL